MNVASNKHMQALIILCVASAGIGIGFGLGVSRESGSESHEMSSSNGPNSGEATEQKVLYWYDPMYPQQQFDQPGPSPFMDMDLVPRYADRGAESDVAGVRVDASMRQSLGMRTAPVLRSTALSQLEVTGQVTFNDRSITRLQHPRAAYVEAVWPLATGDQVEKGQPLVRVRTPEWTAAQFELVALLATEDDTLIRAGKERARSLGMPDVLIRAVEQQKAVQEDWIIRAPIAGVVRSLDVRAGMTLSAGAPLLQLNSLDSVWVLVSVPQSQGQLVARGDLAEVYIDGVSSPTRQGRVAEILPLLDSDSRNVSLRIELDNSHGDLRPGLSARVKLSRAATTHKADTSSEDAVQQDMLVVPTESLIRTGTRTLVMLSLGDGLFQPAEVRAGADKDDMTVIEAGLQEGEMVVISGQFLLDSEASLQGVPLRLLSDDNPHARMSHEHQSEGSQP
ncbi:MAG: efflux RND transporter periplasmic adaptor subunit [Gammaproteobacteria bacterium]|jgi:membrane fusion protein, copper/silver efflux system|nr:efflux RND transporter periplasmic adaptor subunit [Gammaproteobacteria bacterium]MBQ0773169.1 efflux RND transporter periplasmic adaptor subunit [Gammaproteobacteria bacterium]